MPSDFKKATLKFEQIERQLEAFLGSPSAKMDDELRLIDEQLAKSFDEIFQVRILNLNERVARISFFIEQIRKTQSDSQFAQRMLAQILIDLAEIQLAIPKPNLKLISNVSRLRDGDTDIVELCYTSCATQVMDLDQLTQIKSNAAAYNRDHNITGILTYDDKTQQFLQLLEGPEDIINSLMDQIIRDTRHHEIVVRFQSPIKERLYRKWAMGLIMTSQVRDGLSTGESVSTWVEEFLGLNSDTRSTRGHRWMVESITALTA